MLPNLVVVGAQKCGTSALHYYLSLHPDIEMSRPKELNFFIAERNWPRGRDWYASHFPTGSRVRGESSPNYTANPYFAGVPGRMHSVLPGAKLIYLVRDPVERIMAQYVHNRAVRRRREASRGWFASGDLAPTIFERGSSYIPRSRYHEQIQAFLDLYPEEQLLVLAQDDLRDDRAATLRRAFRFLGVDETFEDARYSRLRHETDSKQRKTRIGTYGPRLPAPIWSRLEPRVKLTEEVERPVVDEPLRAELTRALKDDIDAFREFTGREFADWSI